MRKYHLNTNFDYLGKMPMTIVYRFGPTSQNQRKKSGHLNAIFLANLKLSKSAQIRFIKLHIKVFVVKHFVWI